MHFRDRGGSIQIVRTRYNPDTKRGVSEVVGRLDRLQTTIDEALRSQLSAAEIQEVEAYVAERGRAARIDLDHAARHFGERVALTSEWLQSAPPAEAGRFADSIQRRLAKLRRQIANTKQRPA